MRLEAVSVCVGYTDYLAFTHYFNRHIFDNYIIVTSPSDRATQDFCKRQNVKCVVVDISLVPGKYFDKGTAINAGLRELKYHDWVIHLDLDIVLPRNFRTAIPKRLHIDMMYAAKRLILETVQDFKDFTSGTKKEEDFECPNGCGCGYFQMFNWQSGIIKRSTWGSWYPSGMNATEIDWRFRNQWGECHPGNRTTDLLSSFWFPVIHCGAHGTDDKGVPHRSFFKKDLPRIRTNEGALIHAS